MYRRSLLKRSAGLSTAGIAIGSTTASRDRTLRVRRRKADALSTDEIADRRQELLKHSADTGSIEEGAVANPEFGEDEHLVAYNLTITDDVPVEYFGTVKQSIETAPGVAPERNSSPSSTDPVGRIHQKAERKLRLAQRKTRTDSEAAISRGEWEDWEDWTKVGKTYGDKQDNHGNNHGYLVKFKTNPESGDEYVTTSRSEMDPGSNSNDSRFLSTQVRHKHEWSESDPVNAEMRDTEPPSDVGSSTTQMGLSLQSDRIVSINLTNSVTRSNLEVENRSSPNQNNYHKILMDYESVDIGTDFTKLNSASSAVLDHGVDDHPPEAVTVDLRARFHDPSRPWDTKHTELSETFGYNIFGEL